MIEDQDRPLRDAPIDLCETRGQVLTPVDRDGPAQRAENSGFQTTEHALRDIDGSSLVIEGSQDRGGRVRVDGDGRGAGLKKPNPKKTGRRGGWQQSSRLKWRRDVRTIDDIAHELANLNFGFTHFVTITPLAGDALTRKRTCSRVVAHLGQALKRRGHLHIGVTVIEHPINADLHGHHLVHVPRGEFERIESWRSAKADIRVQRITDLKGLLGYLLKERQRLSPDFEAKLRANRGPRWRRCRPVPGRRWSITTFARLLMDGC